MVELRVAPAVPPTTQHQIPSGRPGSGVLTGVVVGVAVICALYFGSEVLIPITLAVLLSFVLSPLMELLRRIWLPRGVAALLAVLIAIGVIIALGGIIGTQIAGLAGQVQQYRTTIETKVNSLRKLIGTDLSNRFSDLMYKAESAGLPSQQEAPTQATPQPLGNGTLQPPAESKPAP